MRRIYGHIRTCTRPTTLGAHYARPDIVGGADNTGLSYLCGPDPASQSWVRAALTPTSAFRKEARNDGRRKRDPSSQRGVHPGFPRVGRATYVRNTETGTDVVDYQLHDVRVQVFGDAALVSALGIFKRKDGSTGRNRYTDVYTRAGNEWKVVSAQVTPVTAAV